MHRPTDNLYYTSHGTPAQTGPPRGTDPMTNRTMSGVFFLFLFNDTLNACYLRLYGIRHMVKDHSDSKGRRKERNVLFNDALNTFYFTVIWRQTYGKGPF